jgi:hypothetical protein
VKLLSIQVGLPREVHWQGRTVTTGIFKKRVEGPVMLRTLNLDGDSQADLSVHGGPTRAVYVFGRPTMEDLRQDLRAVTKKCRPDWDITTPELKTAWQQGKKELFYPYGKTYAQTLGEQD